MRLGRAQHSEEGSFRSGKPKEQFDPLDSDIAGEGNAQEFVVSYDNHTIIPQTDMKSQVESWQEQARKISATAGILAGGDGSARKKKGVINGAYGWGVCSIGEPTVECRQNNRTHGRKILCSGGNVDWAMESARSNTRAEQTHILAAMIQLLPVGLDVLYAVDYTRAIDNVKRCSFGPPRNGLTVKTEIQWKAFAFMKLTYKEAGIEFKCFHNRKHPERRSPKLANDYNALERVAVLSDELAERVGIYMANPQEVPYIPDWKRWTVSYSGEEIVKPLRRQMKKLARICHNEVYCSNTRDGALEEAAEETSWDIIAAGGLTRPLGFTAQ
jgi:hypothetical protein